MVTDLSASESIAFDGGSAILIDQQCWFKITSYFGLVGPEIMFFCHKDPMLDAFMPDLEPFKATIHMFDNKLQRLNVFKTQ